MDQPRPIAIANFDLRASGTVAKSIEIAAALAEAGIPTELWFVQAEGPMRSRIPATIPVFQAGSRPAWAGRGWDLAMNVPALARLVRRRRPAVLLSGGKHFHFAADMGLRLSGLRSQVRLGFRASNSARRPVAPGQFKEPGLIARAKYRGADFIGAVSHELADEVRGMVSGKQAVYAIPNGVDLERVQRLAAEPFDHPFFASDGPVLCSVGRIARQKGFDLLVRALAMLPQAKLLIVGQGNEANKANLHQLIAELGVGNRVDLLGFRDNPFAVMARADAYVAASRWEGASNALIEALACGLPLVATNAPTGNREILADGANGTLAPVEDAEGLARAIETELALARSRDEQRLAAAAFDLSRCLDQWVTLLAEQRRLIVG